MQQAMDMRRYGRTKLIWLRSLHLQSPMNPAAPLPPPPHQIIGQMEIENNLRGETNYSKNPIPGMKHNILCVFVCVCQVVYVCLYVLLYE